MMRCPCPKRGLSSRQVFLDVLLHSLYGGSSLLRLRFTPTLGSPLFAGGFPVVLVCQGDQRVTCEHELTFTTGFALGSLGCSQGERLTRCCCPAVLITLCTMPWMSSTAAVAFPAPGHPGVCWEEQCHFTELLRCHRLELRVSVQCLSVQESVRPGGDLGEGRVSANTPLPKQP